MGKLYRDVLFALLFIQLITLAIPLPRAQAFADYTFTVNDPGDAGDANPGNKSCATSNGKCTLRAAFDEINKLKVLGQQTNATIHIPAMTINVNSELDMWSYAADNVAIFGAGIGKTIIDGQNKTRVFSFRANLNHAFDARTGKISVYDLTIQNGRDVAVPKPGERPGRGGGIYSEEHLSLTRVQVQNSTAYLGGGVYVFIGGPTNNKYHPVTLLTDVTVSGNHSTSIVLGDGGGGIYNGSEMIGWGVSIRNNTADAQGAGLYVNSAYLTQLNNFNISGNVSDSSGGGIDLDLGEIQLLDGIIDNNRVLSYAPNGVIPGGAGVYVNGTPEVGHPISKLTMRRVAVSNNIATAGGAPGGGVVNTGNLVLDQVSMLNNQATYGAALYSGSLQTSRAVLSNVVISGNVGPTDRIMDSEGAGIFTNTGYIEIINSTIINNDSEVGGGISNRLGVSGLPKAGVALYNTILTGNTVDWLPADCLGSITSGNNNIFGRIENPNSPYLSCTVNFQNQDKVDVDPRLGSLLGFPGFYPLLVGSPAINAGNNSTCAAVDIRGVRRPQGTTCDIGAFEAGTNRIYIPYLVR